MASVPTDVTSSSVTALSLWWEEKESNLQGFHTRFTVLPASTYGLSSHIELFGGEGEIRTHSAEATDLQSAETLLRSRFSIFG